MSIKYQFEGFITFKDGKATLQTETEIMEALNKILEQYKDRDILEDGYITKYMSRDELDKDVYEGEDY